MTKSLFAALGLSLALATVAPVLTGEAAMAAAKNSVAAKQTACKPTKKHHCMTQKGAMQKQSPAKKVAEKKK